PEVGRGARVLGHLRARLVAREPVYQEARAHLVLEGDAAALAGAQDGDVTAAGERPRRGGAQVDEPRDAHGRLPARGEQGTRAVARGEHDGPAVDALAGHLERRVAQV